MKKIRLFRALWALCAVGALTGVAACGGGDGPRATNAQGIPEPLRVGILPVIAPEEQGTRYEPLADYLAEELGGEVDLLVATDYAGVVSALAADRIDLAYLGGLTYVQAEEQVDVLPLVTETDEETGTTAYLAGVVVREDSPFGSLEEVVAAEATFAFGDVSSTSGSLYARLMLNEAGAACSPTAIDRCPPLSEVFFTGGHDATAQAVLNGSADAGGLELRMLHRLERDGSLPEGSLRVIDTREVMGYAWVIRTALGERAARSVTEAFLGMDDPRLLDLMQTTGYQPVTEAAYQPIREHAEELGLITTG